MQRHLPHPSKVVPVALALAAVAATIAYASFDRPDPAEPLLRSESARALRRGLETAPEGPYLHDYARNIKGYVVTSDGEPVAGAAVRVINTHQTVERIIAHAEHGLSALFAPPEADERHATSGQDGKFEFPDPTLGNKLVFVTSEAHAPVRQEEIQVRDGIESWVKVSVSPPRTCLLEGDGRASAVRPIYGGFWPDLDWIPIGPDERVTLQWRVPDGYPVGLAVRERGGRTRLVAFRPAADGAAECSAKLAQLGSWSVPTAMVEGLPRLIEPARAIALATGRAAMRPPPSGTASLHIKADGGFATVTLALADGTEYSAYADAYGELTLNLSPGYQLVRTRVHGGLWTPSKGVFTSADQSASVEFFPVDRLAARATPAPALMGFVRRRGQPVAKAVVFCQRLSARPLRTETNEFGFFRFDGLSEGAPYELAYGSDDSGSVRNQLFVPPRPAGHQGGSERRVDLDLSGLSLRIALPAEQARGRLLLVNARTGLVTWIVDLSDGASDPTKPLVLRDVPPGTYVGRVARDPSARWLESAPVELRPDQVGESILSEGDWAAMP